MLNRRQFLTVAGLGTVALSAPLTAQASRRQPVLVLVELRGGNDGLNTVVPFADPAYEQLRPGLHIRRDQVLGLTERLGLHPAMEPLMKAWRQGDLAITQGVGYPNPNRSHFRSSDIWESASDADDYVTAGWLGRLLAGASTADSLAAEGLILDASDPGPLSAPGSRAVVMKSPQAFLRSARRVRPAGRSGATPALTHVLGVEQQVQAAASAIADAVEARPDLSGDFQGGQLGKRLQTAAELVIAGLPVACIKVGVKGFDTHAGQLAPHANLLGQLARGLAAFREALRAAGRWQDVLVVTVSEFGRRPRENGSAGTDHGTAAPVFALGGRVKGGMYGATPSLTDLQGGDLKHAVDFRSVYTTIARGLWGLNPGRFGASGFERLAWL